MKEIGGNPSHRTVSVSSRALKLRGAIASPMHSEATSYDQDFAAHSGIADASQLHEQSTFTHRRSTGCGEAVQTWLAIHPGWSHAAGGSV